MSTLSSAIRVRPAVRADIADIAALEAASFTDPWTADALATFWGNPGALAWLAESADGLVVGFALFRVVVAAKEGELLRVATAPAWRRQRVATGLLSAAFAELDRQSIDCFLEVRADNLPAQEVYQRHGFDCIDRRSAYYRDGCDAWIYARRSSGSA